MRAPTHRPPWHSLALLVGVVELFTTPLQGQAMPARPNVVLIITDDVGYGDLGSYGAPDVRTPNIDRLAREGVRFTDFYANGATCTPTRAALISGRYQQRFALERPLGSATTRDSGEGLPATGRSLPRLLANNGYATALIGKWHLGYRSAFSPLAHGFDHFFGFKSGYIDYYQHTGGDGHPDLFENDTPVTVAGYMTDLITDRSIRFIGEHRDKPFFIDVAYNAAHWPYQRPDSPTVARDNARHLRPFDRPTNSRADYVSILERADQGVGRILRTLDSLGLARNTIVIFTNDNGGEWLSRNVPLFHHKGTVWEGGIRVPAIIRWPAHLPAGKVSGQVGITMDLVTTILTATGTPIPPDASFDGIDLFPAIAARGTPIERTLFWRVTGEQRQSAVRSGDWKLVIDGPRPMLFNVRTDLGERTDLIGARPEIAQRLGPLLAAWQAEVDREAQQHMERRRP
ncbi:MAG: sulfatase-like hydrolase/transferase [Gemmatimonadota bacterium]